MWMIGSHKFLLYLSCYSKIKALDAYARNLGKIDFRIFGKYLGFINNFFPVGTGLFKKWCFVWELSRWLSL